MKAPDALFIEQHATAYADLLRLRERNERLCPVCNPVQTPGDRLVGVQVVVPLIEEHPAPYEWDDT